MPTQPNENKTTGGPGLSLPLVIDMAWCLGLALFWVVFTWGFWSNGIYNLGLNAFVFAAGTITLFIRVLRRERRLEHGDLYWIVPLALLALSYLLYENPFVKMVNVPVYTALAIVMVNFGFLRNRWARHWDAGFVFRFIRRVLALVGRIGQALGLYIDMFSPKGARGQGTVRKVVTGIVIFLVLATTIVIPLLSSADPVFGASIQAVYDRLRAVISETAVFRTVVFAVLSLLLLAALLAWAKPFDHQDQPESGQQIDPIVTGIVIGGILALYLGFIGVQFRYLWVGSLPFDFSATETFVKSGFWQLFLLTVVNTLIYFFAYRRTNTIVQRILVAFTGASFLLLASAGQRMFLYVTYYGLSYEKFFASYTVIFSAILYVWLTARLFMKERANIFRFIVFLFLWMWSVVAVLPVEQIIMRSNIALANRPDTRIRLYELTMLSTDVLPLVKRYQAEGRLEERAATLDREKTEDINRAAGWSAWIEEQEKRSAGKRWYEKNLSDY